MIFFFDEISGYNLYMKSFFSPQTKQFIMYLVVLVWAFFLGSIIYALRDLIVLFLIASFIALLLSPFVARLNKWKIPDVPAIFMTFLWAILIVVVFILSITPVFTDLAKDTKTFVEKSLDVVVIQAQNDFPILDKLPMHLWEKVRWEIVNNFDFKQLLLDENKTQYILKSLLKNIDFAKNFLSQSFEQFSTISLSFASGVTTVLTTFFLLVLLTFFIILERSVFIRWFFAILPHDLGHYFKSRKNTIANAIYAWLRGQLLLALFMFSINLIGLFIAQLFGLPVSHIFSLALIAGAMEFVPYLWPIIAFLPAFLMVLVSPEVSFWAIAGVIILYIIFQQLEGNIMVPLIMSRTLSLSPLYILMMTLIGAVLAGILWVLLSIPLASVLHIFYHDWMHFRNTHSVE